MKVDVCIIGSGPSGLFAAFQCGMLGLSSVIVESLSLIGGQCSEIFTLKKIYMIFQVYNLSQVKI